MTREEAIEVYHGLLNQKIKEAFEVFAPELKESEDEIHRKWILEYLYDGLRKSDEQFKGQFKSAIDWLEKQKEQKPEAKLTGWVARDKEYDSDSGLGLVLFKGKPRRACNCWIGAAVKQPLTLTWEMFPDLKWEDEPMEVEITITKK